MPEPLLSLEGIVKDYGSAPLLTRVLRGIDLKIEPGEFTALIGPSGSGKTTLLNVIGLLHRASGGRMKLAGTEIAGLDDDALTRFRGRTLGFVFQFHHLIPALTARENVMVPMWAGAGTQTEAMRRRAAELLEAVGLGHKVDSRATKLSGGQAQRVAIARSLANDPALVVADEPTGNLDTRSADEIFELLRRVNRERGTAFLVVTHDPRMAQRADRIVEIVDGRIVSDSPSAQRAAVQSTAAARLNP